MPVNLPRLVSASRRFLDELNRHAAQHRDPGYDRDAGVGEAIIAAGDLGLALQGRENPWDPLPEAGQLPWDWVPVEPDKPGDKPRLSVRSRAYASRDERDAGEAIRLQAPVIRDAIPKLLRWIGVHDPRELGKDVGPEFDLNQRMLGHPSVLGVNLRHGDERLALEALERAVRCLEAVAGRIGSPPPIPDVPAGLPVGPANPAPAGPAVQRSGAEAPAGPAALSDDARAALEFLSSEFDALAAEYPDLEHVLIDTPTSEAFNEAELALGFTYKSGKPRHEIQPLWRDERETQVFIAKDHSRGVEAYEAFGRLAEQAVEILAANGTSESIEALPAPGPDNPLPADIRRNHYAKEWMSFVHRIAKERPGGLPRVTMAPSVENFPLKQGGMAGKLYPGVFKASSRTIGRILTEATGQARQAPDVVQTKGPADSSETRPAGPSVRPVPSEGSVPKNRFYAEPFRQLLRWSLIADAIDPIVDEDVASLQAKRDELATLTPLLVGWLIDRFPTIDRTPFIELSCFVRDVPRTPDWPAIRHWRARARETVSALLRVPSNFVDNGKPLDLEDETEATTGASADPLPSWTQARPPEGKPAAAGRTGTPLEITLKILKGSSKAKSLVKFLHRQTGQKATLRELTRRFYSQGREPTADRQETAKQQIRRTATALAERKAPLRIEYDWDQDEISLVDVAATSSPDMPSGKDVADVVK